MKAWMIGMMMWTTGLGTMSALGGAYEPGQVPGDAMWVAHVDLRAAIDSQLGQLLVKDFDVIGLQDRLAALRVLIGVNPLTDFDDATLYGKTFDEKTAVLLVHTRGNLGQLEALAKTYAGYETTDYKGSLIHSWVENQHGGNTNRYAGVYSMAGDGSTMIVSSMDLESVQKQMDLLGGTGESLADGNSKLAGPDEGGVFVFASLTGLSELGEIAQGMHSEMLKAAESLRVVVAEREGQMWASVQVTAATLEQATAIQQLAMGAIAIARLSMPADIDPNIRNLMNRLSVTQVDRVVKANISYASAELHGIIKKTYEHELQRFAQPTPTGSQPADQEETTAPSGDAQATQP